MCQRRRVQASRFFIKPVRVFEALSTCALLYKDAADLDLIGRRQAKSCIQEKGWIQEKRDVFVRAQVFSNAVPSMLLHTVCDA